jgi:hypothetical protein
MFRLVRSFALVFACFAAAVFPAFAADDPYTVRNIHVDASAVSATEAYSAAIAQGRPKAWQTVYRRLTRSRTGQSSCTRRSRHPAADEELHGRQ